MKKSETNHAEQLSENAVSKSLIEITVRCNKYETRGSIDSIKKLLKNDNLTPFFLVKVTDNDEVIYIEETVSKQMSIQLYGDNFKLSFIGKFLTKDVVKVSEVLNADVYVGYFHNQASNNSDLEKENEAIRDDNTIDLLNFTSGYSKRKLHSEINHKCTCNKPNGLVDGGYCYTKDEKGDVFKPCDIGISLNDIMNNADIKG
jgi:ethanolamine utilization protein EutA (predicted chaperonin)